jgi:glycosyltransferase involved in cell wall biosynthesis
MRVAFLLPSLQNRGPIVFTKYLIEGLLPHVESIEVFYFKDIVEIDLPVRCKKISFFSKYDFSDFDIVHTTMLKADLYGLIYKRSIARKLVSSVHNEFEADLDFLYPWYKAKIYALLWKLALTAPLRIVTSSNEQLSYYKNRLLGKPRFELIPYGVSRKALNVIPEHESSLLAQLKAKYTVVGSCGLLIERKGFEQLVQLLKDFPDFAVVIIGEGEQRSKLEQLSERLGVSDRLILLGFKSNSVDYYSYFDIYAMTSYSEGFGLAMLEAMSQGLPLVCSDLPIYKSYFYSEDIGLFHAGDQTGLNRAVSRIASDLRGFGSRSYKVYSEYFSLEAMASAHLEMYQDLIGS